MTNPQWFEEHMSVDSLELQLAAALQRFNILQRRVETHPDSGAIAARAVAELGTALEEIRVAQEQIVENRVHLEKLHAELSAQCAKYWELFDEMPQPYVVTRSDSIITEVNRAGAELFNVSQRFLVGKAMSVFVCEDRSRFLTEIARLATAPDASELAFKLRPRERAPLAVQAKVKADAGGLRWVLNSHPVLQG
ncbi:MAG TPA: PAS domain-containing protein [Vicinamibacterales bacterium]